jgi:hypothetical protein
MRVLLSTYGSRGDVEPMVALAVRLRALGAEGVVRPQQDQLRSTGRLVEQQCREAHQPRVVSPRRAR